MAEKKTPQDYPQLSFRISAEDKINIMQMTDEVLETSNRGLSSKEKVFRKNDILVDALYLGLIALKQKRARIVEDLDAAIKEEFI
jgi:hypothetical protein